MGAVGVADVGAVHGVCHQDVGEVVVEGSVGLEDVQGWECERDVPADSGEPGGFSGVVSRVDGSGAAEGDGVGGRGEGEVVADGAGPDEGAGFRGDTAPPELAGARFADDTVPVGENVLFPDAEEGAFGVVLSALGGG